MIGAGVHTTNMLYPSFNHISEYYERVAVCDLVKEKAEKAAVEFGFEKVYTDYRKMIDETKVDGVVICINGKKHPAVVIDCLKMGVDVLVEKPIAINVEDAVEIEEVAKKYKKIVMVEHQKRYSVAYNKAMEIVKRDDFGEIQMIESKMHGRPYDTLFNSFVEWQIHDIDIIRAFGGDIKEIKAMSKDIAKNRAAIAIAIKFESGAVGTINWGTEGGFGRFCERLEVVGSNWKGVIVENARDVIYYDHNNSQEWKPDWQPFHQMFTHYLDGYVGMLRRFAECINTREEGKPSATDERKDLEFIFEVVKQLNIPVDWKYCPSEF